MPFSDQPFRIPRYILARLAAEEYFRAYWWFVAIPPAFGIICLFTGSQVLYSIGLLGILWPVTLPARAVLTTAAAGKFFSKPVSVRLEDNVLYFYGAGGKGMKLSLANVRKIEERNGYVLLIYGMGRFTAVPQNIAPNVQEIIAIAEAAREPKEQE